jgi:hypothetical protein
MKILLQFNMEQLDGASVPSPIDHTGDIFWLDRGAKEMAKYADMGVDTWLFPPQIKGASMGGGYDPYNHYDLGNLSPCRFGSRELYQRAAAIAVACGMEPMIDFVGWHMQGGSDDGYTFSRYKSATGSPGRFPKDRTCFNGPHSKGDWPADPSGDFAFEFGRKLAYLNGYLGDGSGANRRGYVQRNMADALRWHLDAIGSRRMRVDNGKSMCPQVMGFLLSKLPQDMYSCMEFYDADNGKIKNTIFNTDIRGRMSAFDFAFFFILRDICNNASGESMTRLRGSGLHRDVPMNATTWTESHDTDSNGTGIKFNKEFGMAIACASEGAYCAYYKDLTPDGGYGLERLSVPNTFWCRYMFANGPTIDRYYDDQIACWERPGAGGYPGMVAMFNREPFYANTRSVTIPTTRPNTVWHDYGGNMDSLVRTDANGVGTFSVRSGPRRGKTPNSGPGWAFWAPDGHQGQKIQQAGRPVTQRMQAAEDLDIAPATPNRFPRHAYLVRRKQAHPSEQDRGRRSTVFRSGRIGQRHHSPRQLGRRNKAKGLAQHHSFQHECSNRLHRGLHLHGTTGTLTKHQRRKTMARYSVMTEVQIRDRAYQIYESRGRVEGFAHEDWIMAEAEILAKDLADLAEGESCEADKADKPEDKPEEKDPEEK